MTVPTEEESEIIETVETVAKTGVAHCRLCDEPVTADDGQHILDALAEHGEQEHEWNGPREGWSENGGKTDR